MTNRRTPILVVASCLMMLRLGGLIHAQQAAPALIVAGAKAYGNYLDTDLYRLDDATDQLTPLTGDGYKTGYQLAPDGGRIAYLIAPGIARQAAANGNPDVIGLVWDIEVYEIASGQRTRIAGQPADAKLNAGQISGGRTRSAPVWSPDGTMLAWTEQAYPGTSPQLMAYNFADGTTHTLDNALPPLTQVGNGLPTKIAWGQPGILVFTNDPTSDNQVGSLRLYDPVDGLLRTIPVNAILPDQESAAPPRDGPIWLENGATELPVIQLADGNWYGVKTQTGETDAFEHNIELVSATHPDQSLAVEGVQTENALLQWQIATSADPSAETNCTQVAIAPAGDAVACWNDGLSIWQNNMLKPIDTGDIRQNITLLWGALQWQVHT